MKPAKLSALPGESAEASGSWRPSQYGIVLVDARDRIKLLTDSAAQLLADNLRRGRPQTVKALPVPLQELIAEARSGKQAIIERKTLITDDLTVKVTGLVTNLPGGNSAIALVLQEVIRDSLEQNLRQLDRLASVGTLATSIAHEIKNALVVGKTFFDLLLEKHEDADLVELVRRELTRIESLVTQMLQFSGPGKPVLGRIHLHDVLDHSVRLVERQIKDKSIQLKSDYAAACDTLRGDAHQLEQAFVNILLNAIEAMGPHGQLTINTSLRPTRRRTGKQRRGGAVPQLSVTITDTGAGIPPENLGRLFGTFFTTKQSGTGLGLAITRRIIQEHGGEVTVKSKPNEGASFQISLPS